MILITLPTIPGEMIGFMNYSLRNHLVDCTPLPLFLEEYLHVSYKVAWETWTVRHVYFRCVQAIDAVYSITKSPIKPCLVTNARKI